MPLSSFWDVAPVWTYWCKALWALLKSLAIPCPLVQWQQQQWWEQQSTTTTVATVQTTMLWHHWPFLTLLCDGNHGSSMNDGAQQQKAAGVWTMVPWHCWPFLALSRIGDYGSNASDGAWQLWHWTTLPWHCWPFLACSCKGVNGGSTDNSPQQQWWPSRRWCFGSIVAHSLPSLLMAKTAAAWTNVHYEDGGGSACWSCYKTRSRTVKSLVAEYLVGGFMRWWFW